MFLKLRRTEFFIVAVQRDFLEFECVRDVIEYKTVAYWVALFLKISCVLSGCAKRGLIVDILNHR